MPRNVLVVLLVALTAWVAIESWSDDATKDLVDGSTPPRIDSREAAGDGSDSAPPARDGAVTRNVSPVVPDSAADPEPESSIGELRVRVRLADGRGAGAGFTVRALRTSRLPYRLQRQLEDEPLGLDPATIDRFGDGLSADSVVRTDTRGIAVIRREAELAESPLIVVASAPDHPGEGTAATLVPSDRNEIVLTLGFPMPLTVRVIDAHGRPVPDMPVSLSLYTGHPRLWGQAMTDEDGLARLHAFDRYVADARRRGRSDTVVVQVVAPLEDALETRVPLDHDRSEVVELRLPETCELVIRVEGFEVAPNGFLAMRPWPKMPGDFSIPQNSSPLAQLVDGEARFPRVGLDYRYQLQLWVDGFAGNLERRIQSNADGGSTQVLVIDRSDDMLIRARLRSPDRGLLAETDVHYLIGGEGWSYGRTTHLATDAQLLVLVSRAAIGTSLDRLEVRTESRATDPDQGCGLTVDLPDGFRPGVTDLGTLQLVAGDGQGR